ncbi:MAG: accB [Chlamydiales bacterium]|nr:accB [Chlamydiales bacterium]
MELDLRQIKELMAAMGRTGLKKLSLKMTDFELNLERHELEELRENPYQLSNDNLVKMEIERYRGAKPIGKGADEFSQREEAIVKEEQKEGAHSFITSPMVGTLYLAPSPDSPPFLKVGDRVEKGSVVCIIEAMKVMNEVKANLSGVVSEILVESGHPIEFGSKLFRVTVTD